MSYTILPNEGKYSVQTEYKGIVFRSILETKWAKFFDLMDIKWEYEPVGFRFDNGVFYRPDFKVYTDNFEIAYENPKCGFFFAEVKGVMNDDDWNKLNTASDNDLCVLLLGDCESWMDMSDGIFGSFSFWGSEGSGNNASFFKRENGLVALGFKGDFDDIDLDATDKAYRQAFNEKLKEMEG